MLSTFTLSPRTKVLLEQWFCRIGRKKIYKKVVTFPPISRCSGCQPKGYNHNRKSKGFFPRKLSQQLFLFLTSLRSRSEKPIWWRSQFHPSKQPITSLILKRSWISFWLWTRWRLCPIPHLHSSTSMCMSRMEIIVKWLKMRWGGDLAGGWSRHQMLLI